MIHKQSLKTQVASIRFLTLTLSLGLITLSSSGCLQKRTDAVDARSETQQSQDALNTSVGPEAAKGEVEAIPAVGIRDFQQINRTMSALTEVPLRDGGVSNTFVASSSLLPSSNDLRGFSGPSAVALVRLAADYCNVIVSNNTNGRRDQIFSGVAFNVSPANLSTANRDQVIDSLLNRFLRGKHSEVEITEMRSLFDELKSTPNLSTQNLMMVMCTAALSTASAVLIF